MGGSPRRRRRRCGLAGLLALLLVGLCALLPARAAAEAGAASGAGGGPGAPDPRANTIVSAGSFELAKVRILGVPALTVASPVVGAAGGAPDARRRAEVIEGNLQLLYLPEHLCSDSEAIAEWVLRQLLGGKESACDQAPLLAPAVGPDQLLIQRRQLPGGEVVLEARLPERAEPLPLLTVTRADASLNGTSTWTLAGRWQSQLQSRLRHARRVLRPADLRQRWRLTAAVELLLALLAAATWVLWRWNRRRRWRLLGRRGPGTDPGLEQRLQLHQLLGLLLLLAVLLQLMIMLALGVMAIPGKVPLGLELLLQPVHTFLKVLTLAGIALLARTLVTFLLHQWADSATVPVAEQARREQRHRSLLRVSHRLIGLASVVAAASWIVIDIPGVRAASTALLLAGGALLGGLALVFQGLLRDFVAGLSVLLEDRYAIGDWVEIGSLEGDVVDVGVLSTQLRCLDQRVAVIQNSAFDRVVNHTKLRSGAVVNLLVSHRCRDIDRVLAVVAEELAAFHADPPWKARLLLAPQLRGVSATGPLGISVGVLLTTTAGEQWACSRELQRRLVARFQRESIPLADGLELAPPGVSA